MAANQPDILEAAREVELTADQIHRQVGGPCLFGSEALRQRLASLLDLPLPDDDPPLESRPDDARLAGAVISRLDGCATATIIASWLGWTLPRASAALAELDRRLNGCGLRLICNDQGQLRIRERARLRRPPERLPGDLLAGLDQPELRHALAHFVRGDRCVAENQQGLIDFGVIVNLGSRHPKPHPALAAAFAGAVILRTDGARPGAVFIDLDRPTPGIHCHATPN